MSGLILHANNGSAPVLFRMHKFVDERLTGLRIGSEESTAERY